MTRTGRLRTLTGSILIALLAASFLSVLVAKAQDTADIDFHPSSVEVLTGEFFSVDITVDASQAAVDTAQAHILYDPTVLQVVDQDGLPIVGDGFLPDGELIGNIWTDVLFNQVDPSEGRISYAAGKAPNATLGEDATTLFTLTSVRFKALAPASATLTFSQVLPYVTKALSSGDEVTGTLGVANILVRDPVAHFRFDPPMLSTALGSTFTVDIIVDARELAIDSAQAHVSYDPTVLEVVDENGNPLDGDGHLPPSEPEQNGSWEIGLFNQIDPIAGRISYAAGKQPDNLGENLQTRFILTTVRFKALQVTETGIDFLNDFPHFTKAISIGENVTGTLGYGIISVPEAGADFSFAPLTVSTAIGGYFNVDVRVDATQFNVDAAQAYVLYDPTLLEAVDQNNDPIEASDIAPLPNGELIVNGTWKDILENQVDPVHGLISYSAGKGTQGSDATTLFTLTTLRFKALAVTALGSGGLAVGDATLTFSDHPPKATKAVFVGNSITGVLGRATVSVADSPCTFSFADTVDGGPIDAGHPVQFSYTSIGATSLIWDFDGNGTMDATGETLAPFTYNQANTYLAKLFIQTAEGPLTCTRQVVVEPTTVATITVAPSTTTLDVDATQQFSVTGADQFGNAITFGHSNVTWSVLASDAGTVNPSTGLFTAGTTADTFNGAVQASASYKGGPVTDTASVVVEPGAIFNLEIQEMGQTIEVATPFTFTVLGYDQYGNEISQAAIEAAPSTLTWEATTPAAGVINPQSGLFTAGTVANTYVDAVQASASFKDGTATDQVSVTLEPDALNEVLIEVANQAEYQPGVELQLVATGEDQFDNVIPDLDFTWSLDQLGLENNGIIGQNTGLLITPEIVGDYRVTATASFKGDPVPGFLDFAVVPGPLDSIVVDPAAVSMDIRAEQQFTATGFDHYLNEIGSTNGSFVVTWAVEDINAGVINPTGLFTASDIPATYEGAVSASAGSVTGFATVVVETGPIDFLEILPPSVSLNPEEPFSFGFRGEDQPGNEITPEAVGLHSTGSIAWSLTNLLAGSIHPDTGAFIAGTEAELYEGVVHLTVSYKGETRDATATVIVEPGALDNIRVVPGFKPLDIGGTYNFDFVAEDQFGNLIPPAPATQLAVGEVSVTWSVTNPGAGAIDPATGLFTAGTTAGPFIDAVTVAGNYKEGAASGTADVALFPGPIALLNIFPSAITLPVGGGARFVVVGQDEFGNEISQGSIGAVGSLAFSTTDSHNGNVDDQGNYSAGEHPGLVNVTADATFKDGNATATAVVTLLVGPLDQLEIAPHSPSVPVLGEREFTATGFDRFDNPIESGLQVNWSVIDPALGVINENGLLKVGTTAGTFDGVRAVGRAGGSEAASVTAVTVNAIAPSAPRITLESVGDGEATFGLTPPSFTGGAEIAEFQITVRDLSLADVTKTVTATETSVTVAGLANGTLYSATAVAGNAAGLHGPASLPTREFIPAGSPAAPGAPTLSNIGVGRGQLLVEWDEPATNGAPITRYNLNCTPGSITQQVAGSVIERVLSSLDPGLSYTCTLTATNRVGTSDSSPVSNSATPPDVPGAPEHLRGVVGHEQVELSWVAPLNTGGSEITKYVVSAFGVADLTPRDSDGTTTTFVFGDLDNGNQYRFQVHAVNDTGAGQASARTRPLLVAAVPVHPSVPVAVPGDGRAIVEIVPALHDSVSQLGHTGGSPITKYTVKAQQNGEDSGQQAEWTFGPLRVAVRNLDNDDTPYTFVVIATNAIGDSTESDSSNAVTPSGAPDRPTLVKPPTYTQDATITLLVTTTGSAASVSVQGGVAAVDAIATPPTQQPIIVEINVDEPNTLEIRAVNALGVQSGPAVAVVIHDTTNPEAPSLRPLDGSLVRRADVLGGESGNLAEGDNLTRNGTVVFEIVAERASVVTLSGGIDDVVITATGDAQRIEASLEEGANNFTATTVDQAGNVSTASGIVTVTLDSINPDPPSIVNALPALTNQRLVDVVVDGEDGAFVRIEGGARSVSGVLASQRTFPVPLNEGDNNLSITQEDQAGNISNPGTVSVEVDTIAPDAPTLGDMPRVTNDLDLAALFSAEADATVTISTADNQKQVLATGDAQEERFILQANQSQQIAFVATDAAGNASSPAFHDVRHDNQALATPGISDVADGLGGPIQLGFGQPPEPPASLGTSDVAIDITVQAEAGSDLAVAVTDSSDNTRVTRVRATGAAQVINVPLSSGSNTVSTTATDEAGNESVQLDFLINSDADAPPPPSLDGLLALTNLAQVAVSGNAPEAVSVTVSVVGGSSVAATLDVEGDFEATVTLLQNQVNQIQIQSSDGVNLSGVVEASVEHDNLANNAFEILTSFDGPIRITTVTMEVTGLDTGDLVRFRVGPSDPNPMFIEAQSNVEATLNIPSNETTLLLVNVFDPAGNKSSAKSITVTNDQRPPSLLASLAAPPNSASELETQHSSATVWVGTDPGAGITVTNTTTGDTFTAVGAAGSVQVTVNLDEGGNNILVETSDDAGNRADQVELFVEKDTTPPAFAVTSTSVEALGELNVGPLAVAELPDTRAPSLTLRGTAEVGAEVIGTVGDTTFRTTATDGTWRLVMPLEPDSFNEISVVARDSLGNETAPAEYTITRLPNVTTIRGRIIADDLTLAFVTATEAGGAANSATIDPTDGSFSLGGLSPDGSFDVKVNGPFGSDGETEDRFFQRGAPGNATTAEGATTPVNPGFNGAFVEMSVSTLPSVGEVAPLAFDNDVNTQISILGNALTGATEVWLVSGQRTIRLLVDEGGVALIKATVVTGTSAGTYVVRVRTPAGLSTQTIGTITLTEAQVAPLSVVTDLSQLSVIRGTSPTITALGTNLATATEIVITNVDSGDDVAVQPEAGGTTGSVHFTVPATLPEGTYAPQVRTEAGLGAPAATFHVAAPVELTGEDQVVSDPFTPPATADITWTNEGEENRPGAVGITTVLDSTNTLTDEAGSPITTPLLPPTDVPLSNESLPEGFSGTAVGLEMGLPGERVNLDHPIVVTLTMELPAGDDAPTIFLRTAIGPPPVFELAGIDGEVDGVSYVRGGIVIDMVTTEDGTTKLYTLAFLTDHFSTYVATDEELAEATPPTVPQNVNASAGNAEATVTWTASDDDGGVPLTHYTVTALDGTTTVTTAQTQDGTTTTATVTGLTNGTEYTFTVTASNQAELTSPASVASDAVTPATVPDAPTGAATTIGDTQSVVTWKAPADDGGSNITGYTVTSSPEGIEVTVGDQLSANVTGLTNLTTYTFTGQAINALGTGVASVASKAVTPAPANQVADSPTNVEAVADDSQATVTWNAPAFVGGSLLTGYTVTALIDGTSTAITAQSDGSNTAATVMGLTNGQEYTFTVVATNGAGDSAASAASDVVTPAGPIATLTINANPPVDAGAQQTFTVVGTDAGGNPITQEQIVAENTTLTWSVLDAAAGTIDGNGVFTAKTVAGTFTDAIKATANYLGGTATDTATVVVEPAALAQVDITPDSVSLNAASQQAFAAAGTDQYLNNIPDLVFTWSATGGSITQQGLYTAGNTPGSFDVTAEANYKSATQSDTAVVTITGAAPAAPRPPPTPTPVFTPVPVTTVQAPPGAGAAVILPNAGGEVTTADGAITLSIPPWSSDQTIQVVVEPIEIVDAPEPPPGTAYARAFEIVVYDAQGNRLAGSLNEPTTVTVKYTDEDLAEVDGDPFRLKLARLDSTGNWTILPTSVNTANKTLTATVERFSLWGVVGGSSSALPAATATATPGPSATSTFVPPSVGDVGAPSGWLLSLLAVVGAGLLVSGGYYLRRKSAGTQPD
jgi:hypothetical protein